MNTPPESILFLRLKGIGEVVMSLGVVEAVHRAWPNARIGFVAEPPHEQLLEADNRIDHIYRFDKRRWRSLGLAQRSREFLAFLRMLHGERYEAIIDLHGVPRSQWLAWIAGGKQRMSRYCGHISDRFFHNLVSFNTTGRHNLEMLHDFVLNLGLPEQIPQPRVALSQQARQKATQWLSSHHLTGTRPVGLHPGAVSRDPWPAEQYAELGRLIIEQTGAPVLVTAGPKEKSMAEEIVSRIDSPRACMATFDHLLELGALLERCAVYVAGDTGPMHLATAVGTPVVAVFVGLSDPVRSGPYGPDHFVFHEFTGGGRDPFCPHEIYQGKLEAERVYGQVMKILSLNTNREKPDTQAVLE